MLERERERDRQTDREHKEEVKKSRGEIGNIEKNQ